jgi:hypothetical protein
MRLPGIEEIANQQRNSDARQDLPQDQRFGEAENASAQRDDHQKLDEIVDRKPEEAVNVSAHEPRRRPRLRSCRFRTCKVVHRFLSPSDMTFGY